MGTCYLVTGAAGFIGFHLTKALLSRGHRVVGLDNLNDYYAVSLKEARLALLQGLPGFSFHRAELADQDGIAKLFAATKPEIVVNLAAQAGVRYSLVNPQAYVSSNLLGFTNILEGCRLQGVKHLVYASSSSVYGACTKLPFAVGDMVDYPISLYAATKKANELMAHTYSHLFKLPTTGLRFFTVYGPWGRPDMALFLFTKAILAGQPIEVFNNGQMSRDFTYVDDIVEGIMRVAERVPAANPEIPSHAPYKLYNIGNQDPVPLLEMIATLEKALGKTAIKHLRPMQPGDVTATFADVSELQRDTGFSPQTSIAVGVERFVAWYRDYYRV